MQTIITGNKLYLHWRKISFILLIFSSFSLKSQIHKRYNLPVYDEQKVHFGYLLGLNYSTYKIVPNSYFTQQDSITSIHPLGKTGFEVGFIFNLRLGEYFDLRALPKVSFYERAIKYTFKTGSPLVADFQSSIIEVPLLLKYKSERRGNNRFYMVGGLKPGFEVGAKKRQNRNNYIATKVFNLTLEYGIGLDNYYPLFKFAPELRFSLGVMNAFRKQDNFLSDPIKSVKPFNISLAIMFE